LMAKRKDVLIAWTFSLGVKKRHTRNNREKESIGLAKGKHFDFHVVRGYNLKGEKYT